MTGGYRVPLLIASWLMAGAALAAPALAGDHDRDGDRCAGSRDVKLVNGRIDTLDARNSVVSSVTIENGRFAAVGRDGSGGGGPCTRVIDLRGRTAVPGLIDNHNHIILLGLRPGHDTRLENAASIADVQAIIRARSRNVPPGEFITAMGGWSPPSSPRSACRHWRSWMPPRRAIRCSSSMRSPVRRRPTRTAGTSSPARASRSMRPAISLRMPPRSPR